MARNSNSLTVYVYHDGGTDADNIEQSLFSNIKYDTQYPGGIFGAASFLFSESPNHNPRIRGGDRVVFRNGLAVVYEGWVINRTFQFDADGQGLVYECAGGWGWLMMHRYWDKPWADVRVDADVWVDDTSQAGFDKCTVSRDSRLRFVPKAVAWTTNEEKRLTLTVPTGQTIKKFTYDHSVAAANFACEFYDATNGASALTAGAGQTYTPVTPVQAIAIRFRATGNNTPASDGSVHATVTNLVMYTETSSINLTEIFTDVVGKLSSTLNSDVSHIGSCTTSLVPFVTDGFMSMAEIVDKAASFGDTSYKPWAFGLLPSEAASTPNGRPVAYAEQFPNTAGASYDYQIDLDGANVIAPLPPRQDFGEIANWIVVEYQDKTDKRQIITPDDDSNLKNTSSIAGQWGQRDDVLSIGPATQAMAVDNGRRYLAKHAWPMWKCDGGVAVLDHILDYNGQPLPASEIRAGKLLRWINFLEDVTGDGSAHLTMLITHTSYDDQTGVCMLQFGKPDLLLTNALFSFPPTWDDEVTNKQEAGQGGKGDKPWLGTPIKGRNAWNALSVEERHYWRQWKKKNGVKRRK